MLITGHDIAMALRAAYLTFHRQADAHFAGRGVTADQFVLLASLAGGDAVTQQELVRRVSSDPNTVRAMLLLLEGRGFVMRMKHPTDGRARSVILTAKGRRMYEKLRAGSEPLRERLLAAFEPEEIAALTEFLGRIADLPRVREDERARSSRKRTSSARGDDSSAGHRGP
jgi:DNA-binding MarR family transcriptional regulator